MDSKTRVVVVDFGSSFVRAGYAGEATPRYERASPAESQDDATDLTEWIGEVFAEGLLSPRMARLRILLLENPSAPRRKRNAIVEALLAVGPPEALAFAPSLVAAVGALSRPTALVVDVGFIETRALAVFHGHALVHSLCVANVGADAPDDELFDEVDGVASLIETCVGRCALETRRHLAANVVPIGGGAMDLGFDARLHHHLHNIGPHFSVEPGPFPRARLAWMGGSILAAIAQAESRFDGVPIDALRRHGPPDHFAISQETAPPRLVAGIRFRTPVTRFPTALR